MLNFIFSIIFLRYGCIVFLQRYYLIAIFYGTNKVLPYKIGHSFV